jgi:hypothetical protein
MKHFLYLSAGLFLHLSVVAQNTFQKTFDLAQDDEFLACIQTADGGFLSAGYNQGSPFGGIVVKTWNDGTVQWSKSCGGTRITDVVQTASGMYYVAGEINVSSNTNFYLAKLNGTGNLVWARSYGKSAEPDALYSMALCPDGGVILSGSADSTAGSGFLPMGYIVKVDSSGNHEWSRYMSGGNGEIFYVTKPVSSGGYLSCGYTGSFGSPVGTEAYAVRWDANGNVQWTTVFGHNNRFDRIYDFVEKPNGGFFVTGKGLYTSTNDNLFLASLDNAGQVVWHHNYDMYGDVQRLLLLQDGNLAMVGYNIDLNLSIYNQSYFIKTDTTGTVMWARQYGTYAGLIDDKISGAMQTSDGGFILSGSTYGTGSMRTSWLIRTDSGGVSGCRDSALTVVRTDLTIAQTNGGTMSSASFNSTSSAIQMNANFTQQYFCGGPTSADGSVEQEEVSVYPVPTHGILNIELNPENYEVITLYDATGRKSLQIPVTTRLMVIDLTGLASGSYMLVLHGTEISSRTIVIE